MNILVTGAAGFIGSHVAEYFKNRGHRVIGFVNTAPKIALHQTLYGDLRDDRLAEKIGAEIGPVDCIHHIAANADPWDQSWHLLQTNIWGTQQLLEYARKCDASFIFSSTSAVYGSLPAPYKEDGPVDPNNNYALSKLIGENIVKAYAADYGLKAVALRYFNTYGTREEGKGKNASMVSQFLWAAITKQKVVLYGDGTQKRDFVCVKDTVQAHERAMAFARGFDVFNVGSGQAIEYRTLVRLIGQAIGKEIQIDYVKNPIEKGYQAYTQADMSKAASVLGFTPQIALHEGIRWLVDTQSRL